MFSCYGALHASNLNEISGMLKTSLLIGRKGLHMCEKTISLSLWLAIRIFKVGFHMKKTVACMTGALWAKRGERDISCRARHECEARDEGKGKIKLYLLSLYFSLSLVSRFALVSRSTRNIAFAPLGS